MGSWSWVHWLIVLGVVLVLFGGGGKIPRLMRDLGQGVTAFKKGIKEDKNPKDKIAAPNEENPNVKISSNNRDEVEKS
jgi:sec-independent protein translocase protein TatA